MENFAREGPKIRMATIFATNSGNSLSPVCTTRKLLQAVQNCFRWIGMGLVLSKRFADDSLNYPFLMGNVGAHTYIYAQGLPFACNLKEKRGKGGLVPPNNRFERTRGTSPLAAQPNVKRTPHCGARKERMKNKFLLICFVILSFCLISCTNQFSGKKYSAELILSIHLQNSLDAQTRGSNPHVPV